MPLSDIVVKLCQQYNKPSVDYIKFRNNHYKVLLEMYPNYDRKQMKERAIRTANAYHYNKR